MEATRKYALCLTCTTYLVEERLRQGGWAPNDAQSVLTEARKLNDAAIAAMSTAEFGSAFQKLWLTFRALVNTRDAWPADEAFLAAQDELLQGLIAEEGVTHVEDAPACPADLRIRLWRGDITTLAADAIVNAANSGMTGCWQPLHYCIDNAIHTFAGVQLRLECARIMQVQGFPEPTGQAKVTPAYNLPCKHVVHTVGPIANGWPTDTHRAQLAASYRACLDAARKAGDSSIALCCISTGVFGFPQEEAASIAVRTVRAWLAEHDGEDFTVVFNVFLESDERIYQALLEM